MAVAIGSEHLELVRETARSLRRRIPSAELDDLVGDGMVGLLQASRSYRPGRGASFLTWASRRIRGEMFDGLRRRDFIGRHGRDRGETASFVSLNQNVPGGEGTLADSVADPAPGVDETLEQRTRIRSLFELPERERHVLASYAVGETQEQIAARLGVSPSRVSQILATARERLAPPATEPPPPTRLTRAEAETLRAAARGLTLEETAELLSKGVETVKSQRKSLVRKLGARNLTHAVYIGLRDGHLAA